MTQTLFADEKRSIQLAPGAGAAGRICDRASRTPHGLPPLFSHLANKPVLLVGGGQVPERKARCCLDAGACVTLVSPALCPELQPLADRQILRWLKEPFSPGIWMRCGW